MHHNPHYFLTCTVLLETFSPGDCEVNAVSLLQPANHLSGEFHPLALVSEPLFGMDTSSSDPNTMTLDEALRQPDGDEFVICAMRDMHKELDHINCEHWKVVHLCHSQVQSSAPNGMVDEAKAGSTGQQHQMEGLLLMQCSL